MAAHLLSKQHDTFDDCLIVGLQHHAAAAGAHTCAQLEVHLGVGGEAGYKGLLGGPTCTQQPYSWGCPALSRGRRLRLASLCMRDPQCTVELLTGPAGWLPGRLPMLKC